MGLSKFNVSIIAKVLGHLALLEAITFGIVLYMGKGIEVLPFPVTPMILFGETTLFFGIVLFGVAWYIHRYTELKKCTSVTLAILGDISVLEGFGFFIASYLGATENSLPIDPLVLLTEMVAFYGVVLMGVSWYLHPHCILKGDQGVAVGAGLSDKKSL